MLDDQKNPYLWGLFLLLATALFLNLGLQPLFLEEPRRALIALEMLYRDNLWVPTEFGEYYYKKPPVWNWIIIAGIKLFADVEFGARFFTVISYMGMGAVVFLLSRKYVNTLFGILSSLFFLISADMFFNFSQLAEIDIFYSFLTFSAISCLLYFYELRNFKVLFILFYSLQAIAFLTKGFPTVAFTGISIVVFFVYKKDWKRLFSPWHFAGMALFALILGGYLYMYEQKHDVATYLQVLWSRSTDRTVAEHRNIGEVLAHLLVFPLAMIKGTLPASFFLLLLFSKKVRSYIRANALIEFCFFMFVANFLIYWISPGSRQRYIYMLYPFVTIIGTYILYRMKDERNLLMTVYHFFARYLPLLLAIACTVMPFVPFLRPIPYLNLTSGFFVFVFLVLYILGTRKEGSRLYIFIASFVLVRVLIDVTLLPYRALDSWPAINKRDANAIAAIAGKEPVHMYGSRLSRTTVFYLEYYTGEIVAFAGDLKKGHYYTIQKNNMPKKGVSIVYEFYNKSADDKYYLVRPVE